MLLAVVSHARRKSFVPPAATVEFYAESKWCDACSKQVRYLMSVNHSYCIECGGMVRLFHGEESGVFGDRVKLHKWQAS